MNRTFKLISECTAINADVARIVINYAKYTEAEKVLLVLHSGDPMVRHFTYREPSDMYPLVRDKKFIQINDAEVSSTSELEYIIEFGSIYGESQFYRSARVSLSDLLPSKRLEGILRKTGNHDSIKMCYPKYIEKMQSAMDALKFE